MEARGEHGGRGAPPQVGDQCAQHGCRVPHLGGDAEGVRRGVGAPGRSGRGLRLQGGPGPVSRAVAHAREGRHGVEEPAHAGGRHTGRPARQLPLQEADLVRCAGGHAGQVRVPRQAGGPQPGQRQTARVGHPRDPTGQWGGGQVGEAPVARVVGEQDLTAPDGAVVAVARAVEGDADHGCGPVEAVLGRRRGDVRVVMLHEHGFAQRQSGGPPRGVVPRVPVRGDEFGADAGQTPHQRLRPPGRLQGGQVAHAADVRSEPRLVVLTGTQRVLQVAAHRERGPHRRRQAQRTGYVPPGPAQHLLGAVGAHPQQGVVAGRGDGPVVGEPGVGQPGRPEPLRGRAGPQRRPPGAPGPTVPRAPVGSARTRCDGPSNAPVTSKVSMTRHAHRSRGGREGPRRRFAGRLPPSGPRHGAGDGRRAAPARDRDGTAGPGPVLVRGLRHPTGRAGRPRGSRIPPHRRAGTARSR